MRNFGIPNTTSRRAVGGMTSPAALDAPDTQRANSVAVARPPLVRINSRSKEVEPFIHGFELGSSLLFLFVVLLPIAIVGGVCIGYAALVSEPVQYQASFKANCLAPPLGLRVSTPPRLPTHQNGTHQ